MAADTPIAATVVDGQGRATQLMGGLTVDDWAYLGIAPVAGTLNLRVGRVVRDQLLSRAVADGTTGPALERHQHYLPVRVAGVDGWARLTRARDVIEVVAEVHLRSHLGLSTGDRVEVTLR